MYDCSRALSACDYLLMIGSVDFTPLPSKLLATVQTTLFSCWSRYPTLTALIREDGFLSTKKIWRLVRSSV